MRKRTRASALALLAGLALSSSAAALTPGPTEDGRWYYEIGGAEPI